MKRIDLVSYLNSVAEDLEEKGSTTAKVYSEASDAIAISPTEMESAALARLLAKTRICDVPLKDVVLVYKGLEKLKKMGEG